jgi:hypothetical protein
VSTPNRLSKGEAIAGAFLADEYFQLGTEPSVADNVQGRMRWNPTYRTMDLDLGGDVTQQVGQEVYVLVKNNTGATLTNGTAVYVSGSSGVNINVVKAQASAESTSSKTLGVLTEDIPNGGTGYCTTFGLIHGLNTSGMTEGAALWLSPTVAGGLTTTKPSAPNHLVSMGVCVRSQSQNGVIFVRVINGFELEELHNVSISNPQDGDVLKYNAATGLWVNSPSV